MDKAELGDRPAPRGSEPATAEPRTEPVASPVVARDGRTGAARSPMSARDALVFQRLAGNAAMSRLMAAPSTPGGAPPSAAKEAGQAFLHQAAGSLGLEETSAPGLAGPASGPAGLGPDGGQAVAQAKSAITAATGKMRTEMAATREAVAGSKPPALVPEKAPEPAVPSQTPEGVASQAEAQRVPVGGMAIPMDEATGPGPATAGAMSTLRQAAGTHPDLVELGEAIGGRIAGLRDRATANAAGAAVELKAKAGEERAGVASAIQGSDTEVHGVIGSTRAQVAESAASTRQSLVQGAQDGHASIAEAKVAETGRLNERIDAGTQEARDIFATADEQVAAAGEQEAQAGSAHAHGLADKAIALGRAEADRHRHAEEDKDLGADKATAVMEVAQQAARQLRGDGDSLATDIAEQTTKAREQVGTEAEPTISGVAEVGKGSADGIASFLGSVDEGVDSVVGQGQEQAAAAESGVMGEIANLHSSAGAKGVALRAQGEAALDAALAAGLADQAKLAGQAAGLVDTAGKDAVDQLAGAATGAGGAPAGGAGAALQRKASGTEGSAGPPPAGGADHKEPLAQLDKMAPALDQAAKAQSAEMQETLGGAGSGAGKAGTAWVAETKANMTSLGATADAGLVGVADAAKAQTDSAVQTGTSQAAAEVDRVSGEVDGRVGGIRQSVDGGVAQATGSLQAGGTDGKKHADETHAQLPAALNQAALSQESWLGSAGHWFSKQLADTWHAIEGMADWRFIVTLAVGIGVALLVAGGVALLIASAPFSVPALAAVLIVGAVAGAAGFAAAQVTGNVLDPDPNKRWYDGVGQAAILGAFVGAAGAGAVFAGWGLAAGTLLVMGAAGVGTVVSNLATGKDWDDHLLANILIIGIFHGVLKAVSDRIPGRGTEKSNQPGTSDYNKPGAGVPEVVVDSAARVTASEYLGNATDGWTSQLTDSRTGAHYGYAEVEVTPQGTPKGGPHLTIDPTNASLGGRPVKLVAKGFSWTQASLRAALDAYRRKFGRGPSDLGGLIAWENLRIFQQNFAKLRAAGVSEPLAAEQAARATPFGKNRIKLGYGNLSVKYGSMADVALADGTVLKNVPTHVYINATPTTPGPMPTIPPDEVDGGD